MAQRAGGSSEGTQMGVPKAKSVQCGGSRMRVYIDRVEAVSGGGGVGRKQIIKRYRAAEVARRAAETERRE
jgi:hypothetical protein